MLIEIKQPTKYTDSLIFNKETGLELFISEGKWFVSGAENEAEALAALEAHNPIVTIPTAEEKLFNATGLTVAEFKALGL
jgi:hypothetical protein